MSKLILEQWEFLKDVAKLIPFIESRGLTATGGELWRTPEQQAIYVKKGLSKTLTSKHLERLAIDLNIFKDDKLITCPQEIGKYWISLSAKNAWGGNWVNFRDYGHFERDVSR